MMGLAMTQSYWPAHKGCISTLVVGTIPSLLCSRLKGMHGYIKKMFIFHHVYRNVVVDRVKLLVAVLCKECGRVND